MIKKILLSFVLISAELIASGQGFVWAKSILGDGSSGISISIDNWGNVYTAGTFQGTEDFDPSSGTYFLTAINNEDGFITKFDASGNFIWAKRMGGIGRIAIDDSANIFMTGWFEGTSDFDPGPGIYNLTSPGASADNFILKLDSAGNFIWVKTFVGNSILGESITLDKFGNIYTVGAFGNFLGDSIDFDPGQGVYNLASNNSMSVFISKLSSSGSFIWAKSLNSKDGWGYSVMVDKDGNVYTSGYFKDTTDFDPGSGIFKLVSNGSYDGYISKLDSLGNFVWAIKIGGSGFDATNSMCIDTFKNIYITGYFEGSVDFNPGIGIHDLKSGGMTDGFILKLDSSGNFIWVKRFGGNGNDVINAMVYRANDLYITGIFEGIIRFKTVFSPDSIISAGSWDVFFLKIDSSGDFLWGKNIGGSNNDIAMSIDVDSGLRIYSAGFFLGTTDFDPGPGVYNLTSTGIHDAFVLKLCSSPNPIDSIIGAKSTCLGSTKTYSVNPVELASGYLWSVPPDAVINSGQNTTSINVTLGSTSGNITVTPFNGCSNGESASIAVKVNPLPVVGISVSPSATVCTGTPVVLKGTGAFSYVWTGGITNGLAFTPASTALYAVTGTDTNGCSHSDTLTIHVIPYPQKITQRKYSVCPGNATIITAENNGMTYLWNTNDTTQKITVTLAGKYIVKISNSSCFIFDTVEVINFISPKPIIHIQNNVLQCTNARSYQWLYSNKIIPNEAQQQYTPPQNGYYRVQTTDSNGCVALSDSIYFMKVFNEIKIYPNPSESIFTIELPNNNHTEYTLQLFDAIGQQLPLKYEIKAGICHLDLSHLASAAYILRISNKQETVAEKKLVKW